MLFAGERKICDQIFEGADALQDQCFADVTTSSVSVLLSFGEAIAKSKRSPEKLFVLLDMFEIMRELQPEVQLYPCFLFLSVSFGSGGMDDTLWLLFQIPGIQIMNVFFQLSDITFNIFKFMIFGILLYMLYCTFTPECKIANSLLSHIVGLFQWLRLLFAYFYGFIPSS